MRYLDLTLPHAASNLALDEALMLQAEAGASGEVLRLWEWPAWAVILGSGGRVAEEADEATCRDDGVPILRRSSGGGTVLLGPGCLLFSLILSYDRDPDLADIRSSYRYILGRMSRALHGLLPDISCCGVSDLAAGPRKFSGNSQQRKRRFLLHHGTLLYAMELPRIACYLRDPPRQPEYRARRAHADFLCNLPSSAPDLKDRLAREWGALADAAACPMNLVQQLVADKYDTNEWTRRR